MKRRISLLLITFASLQACSLNPPKYDLCSVLMDFSAHCIPINQPEKKEYVTPKDQLPGGIWLSPTSYGEIIKYIKELEQRYKSGQRLQSDEMDPRLLRPYYVDPEEILLF